MRGESAAVTGHIDVSLGVHGYGRVGRARGGRREAEQIFAGSTEVSGEGKYGIDDQRLVDIIRRDFESYLVMRPDDIAAIDRLPYTVAFLINEGPVLPELARSRADDQVAGAIEPQAIGAVELHANDFRIDAGSDY